MPMQCYTCPEEEGGRNVWFQPPRHLKRKSSLLNSNGFVFGVLIPKNQKMIRAIQNSIVYFS